MPRKRQRGMKGHGSVTWDKARGRWVARVSLGTDATGKRRMLSRTHKDEKEAHRLLRTMLKDRDDGVPVAPARLTFETYMRGTWLPYKKQKLVGSSYDDYRRTYENHALPRFGTKPLEKITPDLLNAVYQRMAKEDVGERTISKLHALMSNALEYAVRTEKLRKNPAKQFDPPKYEPGPVQALTAKEVERFLMFAKGKPIFALAIMAWTTSLRPSEIYALKWEDVDESKRVITVRWTLRDVNGRPTRVPATKTRAGFRKVKIPKRLLDVLAEVYPPLERMIDGSDYVFRNERGGFMTRQNVNERWWKPVATRARLPEGVVFYDLRATGGTMARPHGDSIALKRRMGHASLEVTEKNYIGDDVEDQAGMADAFDEMLDRMLAPSG